MAITEYAEGLLNGSDSSVENSSTGHNLTKVVYVSVEFVAVNCVFQGGFGGALSAGEQATVTINLTNTLFRDFNSFQVRARADPRARARAGAVTGAEAGAAARGSDTVKANRVIRTMASTTIGVNHQTVGLC